jgi:2-polyprenyl-3-methyl-5-hydroxy-6-metoxy-1,4-benzoquinol methylase
MTSADKPSSFPNRTFAWSAESIARFWNGVAKTRLTELSFAKGAAPGILALVAPYLRREGTHLDFGGGDGDMAEALIRAGYRTAVFEPSGDRAARAAERLHGLDGFLGVDDGKASASYDAVLCLEVIEHVPEADLPAFVHRLSQSVAPGGVLILTCPNAEDLDMDSCLCPNCGVYFHRWQHLRSVTPQWLTALLTAAGFERLWMGFVGFDPQAVAAWAAAQTPPRPPLWKRLLRVCRKAAPRPAAVDVNAPDAVIGNGGRIVFVGRRAP